MTFPGSAKSLSAFAGYNSMMFERLPTVPRSQELLDKAFRRASRYAKSDESAVMVASNILSDNLANLVRKFPSFKDLPPFYWEIVDIMIGIDDIRIGLSRLGWASRQIREIRRDSLSNMKRSEETAYFRKAAFGRMSSVIGSIEKDLEFLGKAREKLRWIPTIDPELPTILVAGYPNVGKSSFISRVTCARPEVASYPFTTKGVFVGHFIHDDQKYQVVDTPGLLDRPFEERNEMERQSVAALRHLKGVVLYIIDPSEYSGYPLESQLRLGEDIKGWIELPVLQVANKSDLATIEGFLSMSTLTGDGIQEVQDRLMTLFKSMRSA
ncbi:MAG: NOG1 family protein [Methanotrichaceae archaeon]|nr:NOG1 family protein [Methanotrichaceae archaeon]MDD1757257.1 NOG1 family protein [Methanotrichaceae archaeon]